MPRKKAVESPPQGDDNLSVHKRSQLDALPTAETTPSKRQRSLGTVHVSVEAPDSDVENLEIEVHVKTAEDNGSDDNAGRGQEPLQSETEAQPQLEQTTDTEQESDIPKATPRRRGRPPKSALNGNTTPSSKANLTPIFETPVKTASSNAFTPTKQAADRSARRKSTKALIDQVVRDGPSDDDQDDDHLAREIYGSSDAEDEDDGETEGVDDTTDGEGVRSDAAAMPDELATPSKSSKRKARPRKARSPTPPRDMPPHEQYFTHNKPGRPKTSDNTLTSLALLTHDEYFGILQIHQDRHAGDIEYLESLHAESFPQWMFELSQGFSLCLYGFGSKRRLMRKFATHLHSRSRDSDKPDSCRIVMVNGYAHTTTLREILSCIGSAIDPTQKIPSAQATVMAQTILSHLSATDLTLILVVNSIDAAPLRKPGAQGVLAQIAAHPQVQLVCSADTPDFPLLWDIGVRSAFDFVFHDCTTFAPFTAELDVVDEVHELLGRKAQRVNGREGVAFVLRSLPENAKNLFRLLVGEVLIAMEEEGSTGDEGVGLEYRMMYNKAVEEFICSSEMAFRTLLKEYVLSYPLFIQQSHRKD